MNRCLTLMTLIVMLAACAANTTATTAVTSTATEATLSKANSADGTEIVYQVWGEGSPALVFIHGWSCDRGYWREQVGPFARTHRVVAVDLGGHGDSGSGRTAYTMEAFGADVAAVLEEENLDDAILIGHSMGGPVAVEAALLAPDRVRGIVGVDNFQTMTEEIPKAQLDAFVAALEQNFTAVVDSWVKGMFPAAADSTLRAEVAADMAAGDPVIGISAMQHVLPWMGGAGATRIEQLKVNITTISSDMHETTVEANRKLVPAFSVRIMEGVGHFPMLEAAERFNELLAEALRDK